MARALLEERMQTNNAKTEVSKQQLSASCQFAGGSMLCRNALWLAMATRREFSFWQQRLLNALERLRIG